MRSQKSGPASAGAPLSIAEAAQLALEHTAESFAARLGGFAFLGRVPDETGEVPVWTFRTALTHRLEAAQVDALGDDLIVMGVIKAKTATFARHILVGRAATNDIVVRHSSVSKLHARVRKTAQGLFVADAGSSNGTFVDDEALSPNDERAVAPGARVRFGGCAFELVSAASLHARLLRRARPEEET